MGTLERLRDAVREKTDPVSTVMLIKEWERDGFPGYEPEAVGTIEALEVKHWAHYVTDIDGKKIVQFEPGGSLYYLSVIAGFPAITKVRAYGESP